ncbi:hypothetical protein EYC84_005668 [Monilinia fructicola]|uniref:Uncharacterized protein n=1 Tax=Monilinia fructicola TaxID=38448 RepID=A0A5M9K058_MONFR|nr:hypothetical protein EYC84_005668 [Monilinia fructicola]
MIHSTPTKKQSKAKQSKAKQSKAKQSKAKQSKAKQSKAKQSKAKQSKAKQSKAKSKAKQNKNVNKSTPLASGKFHHPSISALLLVKNFTVWTGEEVHQVRGLSINKARLSTAITEFGHGPDDALRLHALA